jgi:hypothetical protein
MRGLLAILVFAMCLPVRGAERPTCQTRRYNEDWSFLRDKTERTEFFDPAKYVPLDPNGHWYLSFGAEARLKYEVYSEPVFIQKPEDDVGQPVEIDTGIFDNQRIEETTFWGGCTTGPLPFIPGLKADLYCLGISRENASFSRGMADELRHSLGTRLFGKHDALDWHFEFVGQFGSFGDDDVLAWTAASDTGWMIAEIPMTPRAFLHADIASGDHGGANLGTFNPLFPRGSNFNEASLIGPQNLMDLQPGVEFALTKSVKLTTSCFGDFVKESLPNQSNGNYVSTVATFRF